MTAATPRYIGKETDRRWEHGEDLSLLSFSPSEYSSSGKVADKKLLKQMSGHSMREMMRRTSLSQHTLEAIKAKKQVRSRTLAILETALAVPG